MVWHRTIGISVAGDRKEVEKEAGEDKAEEEVAGVLNGVAEESGVVVLLFVDSVETLTEEEDDKDEGEEDKDEGKEDDRDEGEEVEHIGGEEYSLENVRGQIVEHTGTKTAGVNDDGFFISTETLSNLVISFGKNDVEHIERSKQILKGTWNFSVNIIQKLSYSSTLTKTLYLSKYRNSLSSFLKPSSVNKLSLIQIQSLVL